MNALSANRFPCFSGRTSAFNTLIRAPRRFRCLCHENSRKRTQFGRFDTDDPNSSGRRLEGLEANNSKRLPTESEEPELINGAHPLLPRLPSVGGG